jgi:3-methyladenine DNA glycosylase AlkD
MTDVKLPELDLAPDLSVTAVVERINTVFHGFAGDEEYQAGMSRAVPGARKVYGVRVPQLREMAREIRKRFQGDVEKVVTIAETCWEQGSREHCVVAILMLAGLKQLEPTRRWELGLNFLAEVEDWETCDQLCMGLLGQAVVEDPQYMDDLEGWVEDPNLWVRRAALASTVVLRRSRAEPEIKAALNKRTLEICQRLLDDPEHYVRKAVDWAIREVIRRDYALGRDWLMESGASELTSVARSTLKKSAKKLEPMDQDQFLQMLG